MTKVTEMLSTIGEVVGTDVYAYMKLRMFLENVEKMHNEHAYELMEAFETVHKVCKSFQKDIT